VRARPNRRQRGRWIAHGFAILLLADVLLPLAILLAATGPAAAGLVTTTEEGRSQFLAPVTGVPYGFNISVPHGSIVSSFSMAVSTAPGQAPPVVPQQVTLDLGLNGVDWAFGGGAQGSVGYQDRLEDGSAQARHPVGPSTANFSFLLPHGAQIDSLEFTVVPYVNMSLWNASAFVTVLQGAVAVPLNVSGFAAPEIGDLNGDGAPDLVVSGQDGTLHAYARIGASGLLFNETAGAFSTSMTGGRVFKDPVLRDLDRDGDLDLVVGTTGGSVIAFDRQNVTPGAPFDFVENASMFSGITVPANASPSMGDLDGDGDLDLVIGAADGSFVHYRNEMGEGTGLNWRVVNTFLGANLSVGAEASPALVDIDKDGDLDLVAGSLDGAVTLFENVGNATAPSLVKRAAFPGVGAPSRSTPALVDWSRDGQPDLFFGGKSGLVYYSKALGGRPADLNLTLPGGPASYSLGVWEVSHPIEVSIPKEWLPFVSGAPMPVEVDNWGNAIETVTMRVSSSHFGEVGLEGLQVRYRATITVPDLAALYRAYASTAVPVGNQTVVPLALGGNPRVPGTSPAVQVGAIAVYLDEAPTFLPFPRLGIDEDTKAARVVDLRDFLLDEDSANATFEVVNATNGTYVAVGVGEGHFLAVDAASGDLNNNWTGTCQVVVRAMDERGQQAVSAPIEIEILNVEDPPVIEFIPSRYLGASEDLDLEVRAIDGDAGAAIRFSLLPPSPSSMMIDPITGQLRWSPSSAERSTSAHVVVAATDGMLADTQPFDVYFLPAPAPLFGKSLPSVSVLPGRPEFLNLFDFATGDLTSLRSVHLREGNHPFVNLSKRGDWLALDYPLEFPAGFDRVTAEVETDQGNETVSVDVTILPNPAGLFLAPFPPTPLSRGIVHRIELLRYMGPVLNFRNLSFEVAHPLSSISGLNLTLFIPVDYPGSILSVPVTAHDGRETATTAWTILVDDRLPVQRIGRIALLAPGTREVDLAYALASFGVGGPRWPLTTTSPHLTVEGLTTFRVDFPEWPKSVAARDWWPIERARIRDSAGKDLLEVEMGFDGRSRYLDRVQYFTEDEESVIDASFAMRPQLAGTLIHNISVAGTGPYVAGPVENIVRLNGEAGVGWRVAFVRDAQLEQFIVFGITDPSGTSSAPVSWGIWAVVTSRDDAPTYRGGAANVSVSFGHAKTVDLSDLFEDEERDDLLFTLSANAPGVKLDRVTGWLTVEGRPGLNLTGVQIMASEARNQSRAAASSTFSIQLAPEAGQGSTGEASAADPFSSPWLLPLLVLAVLGAAGSAAFAFVWRREEGEESRADEDLDDTVAALAQAREWELAEANRPRPTEPPAPDDPQMLALEEEWSRVIASRSTDATSAPDDTEAELDRGRRRPPGAPGPGPQGPVRPAKITSSDTETERRAGETESAVDLTRRRRGP
jgi:hypothetical protein